jgi:hypothetical protein
MATTTTAVATYDLYSLQDEVLLLSNEDFYDFVMQVAGKLEAEILKIQGIRSARAFLRSADPLAIFRLECDAVAELKKEAFWRCNDGQFVVKQGIELNLQILADTLKEKHNKYMKKIQQRQKAAAPPPLMTTSVTNITGTHGSSDHLLSQVLSTSSATSSRTVPSEELAESYASSVSTPPWSSAHIGTIEGLINKQSGKIFHSTILKHNEHYHLTFVNENQRLRGIIRCKCGTKISLLLRDQTSSFILSNYYSHLTNSDCSMVTKILREERKLDQRANDSHSRPTLGSELSSTTQSLDDTINSISADQNDIAAIESFDTVTDAVTTADAKRKHIYQGGKSRSQIPGSKLNPIGSYWIPLDISCNKMNEKWIPPDPTGFQWITADPNECF